MIAEQMALKLKLSAQAVLEMMFMAPVLADQEFPPPNVIAPILVRLEFQGEVKGEFALAVASDTATRLALSFMGMDAGEPIERPSVIDVLGELANMLCGHFLGQLHYHDTFCLSTPQEVSLDLLIPRGPTYQRTVHLDQGALSMQVAIEELGWKRPHADE